MSCSYDIRKRCYFGLVRSAFLFWVRAKSFRVSDSHRVRYFVPNRHFIHYCRLLTQWRWGMCGRNRTDLSRSQNPWFMRGKKIVKCYMLEEWQGCSRTRENPLEFVGNSINLQSKMSRSSGRFDGSDSWITFFKTFWFWKCRFSIYRCAKKLSTLARCLIDSFLFCNPTIMRSVQKWSSPNDSCLTNSSTALGLSTIFFRSYSADNAGQLTGWTPLRWLRSRSTGSLGDRFSCQQQE
jgi:hypothetical protein